MRPGRVSISWPDGACLLLFAATGIAEDVGFNRDIRPFLSDTCFRCHGPDSTTREAGLRLDVEANAKARDGQPAIVANRPEASEAVARVFSDDADVRMPPPKSGLKLTAQQKDLFRRWVAEGAKYEPHWSFTRIQRPKLPTAEGHPIDGFIRAGLKAAGLKPSPPASPEKQLRRVSLDLTGLPPSVTEADAFLADVKASGTRRGLRSCGRSVVAIPALRRADGVALAGGGPLCRHRRLSKRRPARDVAVARLGHRRFQPQMPFDQFTIEQLAGDLLPNPTQEQLIATAFNRNNRYNSEEGIPIDEFLLENAVDRVDTTATVWMGLTLGCARCHDHKYDPISQKEYYQLVDYFNDVAESGRAIKEGNSEPWIKTPTPPSASDWRSWRTEIARRNGALAASEPAIGQAQQSGKASLAQQAGAGLRTGSLFQLRCRRRDA